MALDRIEGCVLDISMSRLESYYYSGSEVLTELHLSLLVNLKVKIMIFTRTVTNRGVECIIKDNFKYRKQLKIRLGDISWRCPENNSIVSFKGLLLHIFYLR